MSDTKDIKDMEIRSEEMDAILGKTPNKLIVYGTSVILGFIVLLFAGTMLFPYPEKIDCKFVVTSTKPPIQLYSQTTGQIELFVTDKQQVRKGQILALINNPATLTDVLAVEILADSISNLKNGFTPLEKSNLKLGNVTQGYLDLEKAINDYCIYVALNQIPQKIENMKRQLQETNDRKELLSEQMIILKNDLELSKIDYKRDSTLYEQDLISLSQLEESKSQLYQKENSLIAANVSYKDDLLQIEQLKANLLDLETENVNQNRDLTEDISRNIRLLKSQIKDWKKTYAFISPYDGEVSFSTLWSDNQWVETNAPIMTILPGAGEKVIGRMEIPIQRSGKIKKGQDLILKLSNYPYMEYGVLYGKISSISSVPYEEYYIVEIDIPTLKTNYGYHIPFCQQMEGTASIIIKDLSLFDRFRQPLKSSIINGRVKKE